MYIALPKATSSAEDAQVSVFDGGRGMSRETLERSLRAGYTGKARFGSLGLFGMGFNIATARLGNRTEVRTTRAGDDHWLVTEIDFREMQRRESFHVPLRYATKEDPSAHGTEIIVSDLNPKMLERSSGRIRSARYGRGWAASTLICCVTRALSLVCPISACGTGHRSVPQRQADRAMAPCVWSASRTVSYSGAEISAVQVVDHRLSDAYACMRCGHWQRHYDVNLCASAAARALELRPRRVRGWLGVQRYLHESEYGIDFLRNGRKILIDEKALFTWEDLDTSATLP